MKLKPIKGLEKYADKWVAIDESRSKVVASGENIKDVYNKVAHKKVIFMAVPPLDPHFSYVITI